MSRGVCYVEMNSVVDAMFLHNQLLADPPAIEGKIVEVSLTLLCDILAELAITCNPRWVITSSQDESWTEQQQ